MLLCPKAKEILESCIKVSVPTYYAEEGINIITPKGLTYIFWWRSRWHSGRWHQLSSSPFKHNHEQYLHQNNISNIIYTKLTFQTL